MSIKINRKVAIKILAVISGISGVVILAYIFWPILSYDLKSTKFTSYISPVPGDTVVVQEPAIKNKNNDYTKASTWFDGGAEEDDFNKSNIGYYTISIPKLKIDAATVSIGGEDLTKSLIQYPGTALPGKKGNAVIFGHSILPQFFNPKDYLSIFSTLPTIEKGDQITISYDGVSYNYRVEDKVETTPTDLQVLEQNLSDSFLTLITCVPPGHPLKPRRLVVRARLVPFGKQANINNGQ